MPDEQTEKFAAIAIERPGLRRRFSSVGKDDWFYSVPVRIHAVVGNGTLKGAKADPAGCPSPPSPAPTKGSMCAVVSAKNPSGDHRPCDHSCGRIGSMACMAAEIWYAGCKPRLSHRRSYRPRYDLLF
jgi:hypothetical protein